MKRIAFVKDVTNLWKVWVPILESKGYDVELLDIVSKEIQDRLISEHWDAFIWRAKHDPWIKNLGKRFLSFFDLQQNIKTFPSFRDYSHYDDKITQYYLLEKNKIPVPKTFIFFDKQEALEFFRSADFPVIYKATSGSGSSNVGVIKTVSQGKRFVNKAFGKGIKTFFKEEPIRKYSYFQEYLEGNIGDYKVICFGNQRITGVLRKNVKDEIKKSRSEIYKVELPDSLLEFISDVHSKLGSPPVMSYDILQNNEMEWVVTELGVIYGDYDIWDYFTNAKNYERNSEGVFVEIEKNVPTNDHLFIDLLLKKWGWDE